MKKTLIISITTLLITTTFILPYLAYICVAFSFWFEAKNALGACIGNLNRGELETLKNASKNMKTPPIVLHQIWCGPNTTRGRKSGDNKPFLEQWKEARKVWRVVMENRTRFWTDETILRLLQTRYPQLLSTYKFFKTGVQQADMARLVVLHAFGGAYVDIDTYPQTSNHISQLAVLSAGDPNGRLWDTSEWIHCLAETWSSILGVCP